MSHSFSYCAKRDDADIDVHVGAEDAPHLVVLFGLQSERPQET
jgi:hypothetical protein